MKVYYAGKSENHRLYVQPAVDYPEKTEWSDKHGKPLMFEVHFKNHVAEVDDNLGRYLIEKKYAIKSLSRIINKVNNAFIEARTE
jgi:hypothetical protein